MQAAGQPGRAAIASAHPAATVAGQETLARGGNAFDAAVAIAAALAVVEPYGSGLGGGGFFLLREAGERPTYRFLDARERAPLAAHPDLYRRDGEVQPALSSTARWRRRFPACRPPWWNWRSASAACRCATPGPGHSPGPRRRGDRPGLPRARWLAPGGPARRSRERAHLPRRGEIPEELSLLRQPELARTLEHLARDGHDGFYAGDTAARLLSGVRAAGGIWSQRDLDDYRVVERQPLRVTLADERELISAPPPSAGGLALGQSLLLLQRLPWRQADAAQRSHFVVEALRRAYRDRGLLGDPDFVANPTAQLLAPAHLARLAASIDAERATPAAACRPPATGTRATTPPISPCWTPPAMRWPPPCRSTCRSAPPSPCPAPVSCSTTRWTTSPPTCRAPTPTAWPAARPMPSPPASARCRA
ncbi:gamma-glutamyltransferase [Pseudomonas lalucatii]|nr:gamma-glutamyltransferase [Pseudomonas lalucatii]